MISFIRLLPPPFDMRLHGLLRRWLARRPEYLCTTVDGAKMKCATNDYIESRILHFGEWEPDLSRVMRECVRPGDIFVDVGANIGYTTLLASRLVGHQGRVIAIEPDRDNLVRLRENIALNGTSNVRVVPKGAGSSKCSVPLYHGEDGNAGAKTTIANRGGDIAGMIEIEPLCDLLTAEEKASTAIIKIDIEGGEEPVMRSIIQDLPSFPKLRVIITEISNGFAGADSYARALSEFTAHMLPVEGIAAYLGRKNVSIQPLHNDGRQQFDLLLERKI